MAPRPASGTFHGDYPVSDGPEIAAFDYILSASSYILRHVRAAKTPEDSATYRLQYTAGRKWAHLSDTDVCIVISDSEPEDRGVAMKWAIMLAPGGALYE